MSKLNTKFDANLLLYLLSHFEYNGHTVHMLTQWHLLPPLTSTVKLFTHVHSSLQSLTARLHQCCTNHSHYINNGWAFSVQTSFLFLYFLKGVSYPDCLFPGPLPTSHPTSPNQISVRFNCAASVFANGTDPNLFPENQRLPFALFLMAPSLI